MKIIIEGADGTGKSTLATILAQKYGLTINHCTQNDPSDFYFYKESLRKENTVWDRHTIGELIYPAVFKREPKITPVEAKAILDMAKAEGVKILVLTAPIETIRARLKERAEEEDARVVASIEAIDEAFCECAKIMKLPLVDTSKMTLDEIFNLVKGE